jgi:TRAP-type C4-dicarboxylate transport system permease small subunit
MAAVRESAMQRLDAAMSRFNAGLHYAAGLWLFCLAVIILLDVAGRGLFNAPLPGTAEIVANSVVSIAFLQLCHAVREGRMLRVELLDAILPAAGMRFIRIAGFLLGALLFAAIAAASWEPMLNAWRIREYAGFEGSLRIPVYPVRTLVVAMAALATLNYLVMAFLATARYGASGAR